MNFLESSTPNMSAADFRSASIEKLRAKKRRVRYRNTNMALIGSPINEVQFYYTEEDQGPNQNYLWNDRNKFKMPPRVSPRTCLCPTCRPNLSVTRGGSAKKIWADEICTKYSDSYDSSNVSYFKDDKAMEGVTYSFDRSTGPSHGSQILSQALGAAIDKMENKQLEKLVRDEYDVIQTEDSSSDDEEFEMV